MQSKPGTYVLILHNLKQGRVQIGRWREIQVNTGFYVYVGSAFGPGGVAARVKRHCRSKRKNRWHIDYLSKIASPVLVWYSHRPERLEHQWAKTVMKIGKLTAVKGFGCTDCKCFSHLFFSKTLPDHIQFENELGYTVATWRP